MTSYLIATKDQEKANAFIMNLCKEEKIDAFDIVIITKELILSQSKNTESIGIEQVKDIQQKVYLKPFKSAKKAVVLHDAESLTIPAQNALLKLLEEPPENTLLFLVVDSKENLLETIRSRCHYVDLTQKPTISDDQRISYDTFLQSLPSLSIGEALTHAESLAKDKAHAISWIEGFIVYMRAEMVKSTNPEKQKYFAVIIRIFQGSYSVLRTTHANVRLTLEDLFISLCLT